MASNRFTKDPNAVTDFGINWATWLEDDTIATSEWVDVAGVTVNSNSHTTTTTTVWISGGTVGIRGRATNRITTAAGRTMDQTLYWTIIEK